jgi:hypothetical protein
MSMLALTGKARLWEPRRLRFRLFSAAAQLGADAGFSGSPSTAALERLALLSNPG